MTVPISGTITLNWSGPANMPLILGFGTLATGCLDLGPVGILDLDPATLGIIFNGTAPPWSVLFALGSSGIATQSFSLSGGIAPGSHLLDIQGAVLQPGAPGVVLTAAFRIQT